MNDTQTIINILTSKPAWLKKSPVEFAERLSRLGIDISTEELRNIMKKVRAGDHIGDVVEPPIIPSVRKRLFFDIETSPNIVLSWSVGTKVNIPFENIIQERAIICISWKWENDDRVFSLNWDENQNDKQMLIEFIDILHSADEVVAHNGDNYDIRWIRARAMYHSIPMSPHIKTIDTLRLANSMYLNSRRLDYISKFLSGEGKIKTEFSMWVKILLNNDDYELNKMIEYCEKDVIELERIYKELRSYSVGFTHAGVMNGLEKCTCPECTSNNRIYIKQLVTPRGSISHEMKCKNCNTFYVLTDKVYKSCQH